MKTALILLTAMLAGCNMASPADGAADTPPAAATTEASLEGTYVVTHVNEAEPLIGIKGYEPTVTITADRIHFQSQCIYDDWSYRRDGESIAVGPWDYGEPVAMCARSFAPGEEAIIAALGGADTVRRTLDGMWFSGPQGTVQMRRDPTAEELTARDIDLTGSWLVQALDARVIEEPIPLEGSFEAIWWEPGCAGQSIRYSVQGSTFRAPRPTGSAGDVCDIGFPDQLPQVWEAMHAADTIMRLEGVEGGAVLIEGGGRSVVLSPRSEAGA